MQKFRILWYQKSMSNYRWVVCQRDDDYVLTACALAGNLSHKRNLQIIRKQLESTQGLTVGLSVANFRFFSKYGQGSDWAAQIPEKLYKKLCEYFAVYLL